MSYQPPKLFKNCHIQSIYPTLFRATDPSFLSRERITTDDEDFIDLDWASETNNKKLIIVSHGLEGSALSSYCVHIARVALEESWDTCLWSYRSCSGEMNKQRRYYYSGATDDLDRVITHAKEKKNYEEVVLVGVSMGGNLTLVYAGEKGENIDHKITRCATFSVPCDLAGSAAELNKFHNKIYLTRFLKRLKDKIRVKHEMFPDIDIEGLDEIKTLEEFANRYSGPIHGFRDAHHYWEQCSSIKFIEKIRVPTLIVSALDDPFLSDSCYPYKEADKNPFITLETPEHGGHVGFISFNERNRYWSEERLMAWIN